MVSSSLQQLLLEVIEAFLFRKLKSEVMRQDMLRFIVRWPHRWLKRTIFLLATGSTQPVVGSSDARAKEAVHPHHHTEVNPLLLAIAIYFTDIFYLYWTHTSHQLPLKKQYQIPSMTQAFCRNLFMDIMKCRILQNTCIGATMLVFHTRKVRSTEQIFTLNPTRRHYEKRRSREMHEYYLPSLCRVVGHHLPWGSPEMLLLFLAYLHH